MSRLLKHSIKIPAGVSYKIEGNLIIVKGPKGELKQELLPLVKIEADEKELWVKSNEDVVIRKSDYKRLAKYAGTFWSLINNMVVGVTQGFAKELEIVGVGYRAQLQGKKLVMNLGYAHPVEIDPPAGIEFEVPAPQAIVVKGIDKYLVGQVAANIKQWRIPIVYSGKGIRYKGEAIRTKVGKKV
ncbi:MAG: 50S ribosomal protein L6 [Kosmotogaceae bacterium]